MNDTDFVTFFGMRLPAKNHTWAIVGHSNFDEDRFNQYNLIDNPICIQLDNYLEDNPHLKDVNSPIATSTIKVTVPKECIPVSELKDRMNLAINGELLTPFDFEGDWQSVTVRRMISKPLDSAYRNLDALSDKLVGLVDTGSDAITAYLKFYRNIDLSGEKTVPQTFSVNQVF